MGFLARAVERKSASADSLWRQILAAGYGYTSKAGPSVNLDNALKVSTAFACMRALSQGGAQVPFKLFQETRVNGLKNIVPAVDHPLYDVMTVKPNAWSTSFEFRESLILHACLGNAYVFKSMAGSGSSKRIDELILLTCGVEKIQRPDWSIYYKVTAPSGAVQEFPAEAIWHVRGPSWNGTLGLDVLKLAREALGLAIATEETHSKLHAKGVRPSGTYSVEGTLDKAQYKDLKDWLDREFTGSDNSGTPMILDRGAKWLSQAMTGIDAQHLETRRFQIEEVCRFFGVFPMVVSHSDKTSTFASADAYFRAHVRQSLAPWYARIEQSADAYLLSKEERKAGFYFKFLAQGLLRGSDAERSDFYSKALGSGGSPAWMTVDEIRALEELNPMGGEYSSIPPRAGAQPVAIP